MNKILYNRALTDKIKEWLERPEIIVITGARQTGKTFFTRHILPTLTSRSVQYFNFEDFTLREQFKNDPKGFMAAITDRNKIYVFDEFQRLPEFTSLLKVRYDAEKESMPKIILTGSSSLLIQEKIAQSLVGQAMNFNLYSLSFAEKYTLPAMDFFSRLPDWDIEEFKREIFFRETELKSFFDNYLIEGGYPELGELESPRHKQEKIISIIDRILDKDLQSLVKSEYVFSAKKILEIAAHRAGQRFSFEQVSSDIQLNNKAVRHILALLEGLYFLTFIFPQSNHGNEYKKAPKPYFYDLGVRNGLLQNWNIPADTSSLGPTVENFVFNQLIRYSAYNSPLSLRYWQDYNENEVDFVVKKGGQLYSIEVKYNRSQRDRLGRGIINFIKRYRPQCHITVTYDYFGSAKQGDCRVYFVPAYAFGLLV